MTATIVSVHSGSRDDLSKPACESVEVELEGFVGDAHRSYTRETWEGDKQAQGTIRRNERQWSAVSVEELAGITQQMDLTEPLTAECLGANLLIEGIAKLSRLPKGTLLQFPSGVELQVEEYNPPCHDMGQKLAALHETRSGKPLSTTAFSKAAKLSRGVVGVVEVAGTINAGDDVSIILYETPTWLARSANS
jgi:MOSC domain-containing protein YiiM